MPRNTRMALVQGGQQFQIEGDYIYNDHTHLQSTVTSNDDAAVRKQEALKKLFEHIAPGAFHNSAERHDPPKCHPRTREAILRKILDWARDPHNLRLLMWIYGPAGAGKSAIMQTMAQILEELGILGGSFFFFHTADKRNEKRYLITTLAYQLALTVPNFEHYITATINSDPSIFSRTLAVQMKALIIDPISAAARHDPHSNKWNYVMLVDGLDECSPPESHREIITLISNSASSVFRFIIASRPEFVIRDTFSLQTVMDQTQSLPLDNTHKPDNDIQLFLTDKFEDIKARHPAHFSIPESWPGTSIINTLVQNASGQFIYAATVIKFVESSKHNPMTRLDSIIVTGSISGKSDEPFAQLDALYHHILASVSDLNRVLSILHCDFMCTWVGMSYSALNVIYGYTVGEVRTILCDMHSLLNIPEETEISIQNCISFHHKSMLDFLENPFRAKHLYVSPCNAKASIAISLINQYEASINSGSQAICMFQRIFGDLMITVKNCLTANLVEILSKFNPYKALSMSIFLWKNLLEAHSPCGWHFPMLQFLDIYHTSKNYTVYNEDSEVETFSKLYLTALENLDTWLAESLHGGLWNSCSNALIPLICLSVSSVGNIPSILFSVYSNSCCVEIAGQLQILDASERLYGLQSDIQHVTSNLFGASYQAMQTLNIDPEITLLEYYLDLRQKDYPKFEEIPETTSYWEMFSDWIKFLLKLIATINTRSECGNALKMHQLQHAHLPFPEFPINSPYLVKCKLEVHQVNCTEEFCLNRKYNSILLLKNDLQRLAHAAMDCLKRTNTEIEQHDYNRNHFICFLCQSSEEFTWDGDFGMDLEFDFPRRP